MDSNDIVKGTTVASDVSLGIGKASQGISSFVQNIGVLEWILIIIFIFVAVLSYKFYKMAQANAEQNQRYRR